LKEVLIVWGGWEGHQPRQCADVVASLLKREGFRVQVADFTAAFVDLLDEDLSDRQRGIHLVPGCAPDVHTSTCVLNQLGSANCPTAVCLLLMTRCTSFSVFVTFVILLFNFL
jgi:hypothetical protein